MPTLATLFCVKLIVSCTSWKQVIISYFDATYDYKSFYAPHIDSKLCGYGYLPEEVGYHWLQYNHKLLRKNEVSHPNARDSGPC